MTDLGKEVVPLGHLAQQLAVRRGLAVAEPEEEVVEAILITDLDYYPGSDPEAMEIIKRLDHWEWETKKVSGKFTQNPYRLEAVIDGAVTRIYLPGRFGSVMSWLDREQRRRHEASINPSITTNQEADQS